MDAAGSAVSELLDTLAKVGEGHKRRANPVEAQRDDLLAILKEWAASYNSQDIAEGDWPLMDRTRLAIAKAEK